ncbi:MAG: cache domain-containing protein [Oligoflexia bacterium]|nr:cache domain-containing protein [Oligoflexia bacterium]
MKNLFFIVLFVFSISAMAQENCTSKKANAVCEKSFIQSKVMETCKEIQEKGDAIFAELQKRKFDCCGEMDYVYIVDEKNYMLVHPVKPPMVGKDWTDLKDKNGFKIITEGTKQALDNKDGGWITYLWGKFGGTEPKEKTTYCRKCTVGSTNKWVVACSGTWTE